MAKEAVGESHFYTSIVFCIFVFYTLEPFVACLCVVRFFFGFFLTVTLPHYMSHPLQVYFIITLVWFILFVVLFLFYLFFCFVFLLLFFSFFSSVCFALAG